MSFLRFRESNQALSFKRARTAGMTFDVDEGQGFTPIKAVDSGFELKGINYADAELSTGVVVNLRKHAAIVTVNPQVCDVLQEPVTSPTTLVAGWYGAIPLFQRDELDIAQLAKLNDLDWVVRVHLVMVDTPQVGD